jgi:hypothetical protein
VTDLSQPSEPQSADDLPQNGRALPRREPAGEALPRRDSLAQREPLRQREPLQQSSGSFFERAVPGPAEEPPTLTGGPLPQRGADLPQRGADPLPQRGSDPLPQRGTDLPQRGSDLPQRGTDPLPQRGTDPLPQRGTDLPQRGTDQSQPGTELSQRASEFVQRGGFASLPRRTTRTQRTGRHRSPHRLSVASDAPALVLAVPGSAAADSTEIGLQVAAIAEMSCPGVDIRVGYLDGENLALADSLQTDTSDSQDHEQFPSVVVPLLLSPSPALDARIQQLAAEPAVPAVVAPHLGPHPLIAEALHSRLAEAGLARQARSSGLSISADGRGVVVLADVGEEAASAAAVAAVLLASRLSVPVVPASLGDPSSIVDAVSRLTDSGAARPVLSPCLIGPETNVAVLNDLSAALDAPCAPVLGAHQAIGQLVAIRYGAALTSLSLAG